MPPRPRPRPRPIAKTASFGAPVSPIKPVQPTDDDAEIQEIDGGSLSPIKSPSTKLKHMEMDDDFFDRSSRARLQALSKRAAKTPEPLNVDDDEESTPSSSRKRKRGAAFGKGELNLPKWTQSTRIVSDGIEKTPVLTLSSGSDSEDDVVVAGEATPRARRVPNRPKSLTPPPVVDAAQLDRVRQITIAAVARAKSQESEDAEVTFVEPELDLDPELAAIAAKRRQRSQPSAQNVSQSQDVEVTQRQRAGPENVSLSVRMYPADWQGEADNARCRQLRFKVKRNDPFSRAFLHVSERSGVAKDDLIVTYEHNQVWASATPHSLKIWDEADLDAYSRTVHERVETARRLRHASIEPTPDAAEESQASEAEEVEKLFVHLLSNDREKPMRVAVRMVTKIGKLLDGFLKKSDNVGRKGAIVFEGQTLDPDSTIGDHDLEDGDQLEVKLY
ncbi:hypothetical protein CALVIDRAFT_532913 [Calocera viscosa TUFC12733]|uniref:Rad60/SUMO-like domain-containing protein n=1 Tax=Calocera viscosa (strain TUFC12733) TaxID=1330018 RepID=A0A167RUV6_CALVF|nr:hypothetical protein CALVIDRAFT_532913 [Calocera viscosa TUFC12733]